MPTRMIVLPISSIRLGYIQDRMGLKFPRPVSLIAGPVSTTTEIMVALVGLGDNGIPGRILAIHGLPILVLRRVLRYPLTLKMAVILIMIAAMPERDIQKMGNAARIKNQTTTDLAMVRSCNV
jgi:hypothetical protein